jgi:hypothetical protein
VKATFVGMSGISLAGVFKEYKVLAQFFKEFIKEKLLTSF